MGKIRAESGAVLVVVLIVATIFAVLAFITLQVSLNSLQSTDKHKDIFSARLVAEGGVESGTARLRQDIGMNPDLEPTWLEPSFALSTSEDLLRSNLIEPGTTTERIIESDRPTYEHTAYTIDTSISTYSSDTSLISGSRDDATYTYHDDEMFSEDHPSYEFAPVQSTCDLVVYGVGEVVEPEKDTTALSFLQARFPTVQWTFDVREAGVTEPSRIGPYPYIETEHPYGNDQSRAWVVTYQNDPGHPYRNIIDLRLMANPGEVGIDPSDTLYLAAWLENDKRFQRPSEMIIPGQILDMGYWNPANEIFSPKLDTSTIGLFLKTDVAITDFGFRISGVRYGFDSDCSLPYYETPHPYDLIIPQATAANLNIQVIYSRHQALPLTPEIFTQSMKIQFDSDFSLDAGDSLFLFNASDPGAMAPVAIYNNMSPIPVNGYAPEIWRIDHNLPLGYILLLERGSSTDTDGVLNYGYKVSALEYSDAESIWVRAENPIMECPHNIYLGPNDTLYNIPAFLPFITFPDNYAGYQTIYRPFCPNADNAFGIGLVDSWHVAFGGGVDLSASSGVANNDYIRLTTPGNTLATNGMITYDTIYFVHPNGGLGASIGVNPQYFDIDDLKELIIDCGIAEYMEIEFLSDSTDGYERSMMNFGYRIAQVGYDTSNGADDDRTSPTIRSDMDFPSNEGYPAFGSGPLEFSEWWYSNPDALVVGLHFDRYNFDLDPGDRIEIYNDSGILLAVLMSDSVPGGPDSSGPNNPDLPGGGEQHGHHPSASGPYIAGSDVSEVVVDLDATYGWVLVPGTTAQVKLIGDGSENEGFAGFEIDHCGFVDGDVNAILDYLTDYAQLAYGEYYDRSSWSMDAFRSLGTD